MASGTQAGSFLSVNVMKASSIIYAFQEWHPVKKKRTREVCVRYTRITVFLKIIQKLLVNFGVTSFFSGKAK